MNCRTPFQKLLVSADFEQSYGRKHSSLISEDIVCEISNALKHPDCLEEDESTRLHWLIRCGLGIFSHMPIVVEMIQNMMSPPWLTRPLEERMSLLAGDLYHLSPDSICCTRREFELILGSKLTSVVWEIDKLAERRFTSRVMHKIGTAFRLGNAEDIEGWRIVLRQIVSSGISLTEPVLLHEYSVAPVQQFLFGYISVLLSERRRGEDESLQYVHSCQRGIISLAEELQIAGLDLKQYDFKAASDWKGIKLSNHPMGKFQFRVLLFQQGPQPEDWNLFISDMREEYASECCGDFWDMIEHRERMMPGAWCENAPDFNDWEWSHVENWYRYRPTSDLRASL